VQHAQMQFGRFYVSAGQNVTQLRRLVTRVGRNPTARRRTVIRLVPQGDWRQPVRAALRQRSHLETKFLYLRTPVEIGAFLVGWQFLRGDRLHHSP
jgi:hypothetical protein